MTGFNKTIKPIFFVAIIGFLGLSAGKTGAETASLKALFNATRKGDLKQVETLLKEGLNVKGVDEHGNTLLILAAERGHCNIAEFLIRQGCEVNAKNKNGRTALMATATKDMADLLIKHGAEINTQDKLGWTPLMHAAIHNNTDLIRFLVEKGADVNAQDRSGRTALMMLMDKGSREAVECLLDNGANPNIKDSQSNTALMAAARNGRLIIAALLVSHGADVSVKNKFGKTAKKIAKENSQREMAEFLADPDADSVLGGPAQVRIDEAFLESLVDPEKMKIMFSYDMPVKKKIKVSSKGKEGNLSISGTIATSNMFGCSTVVKLHESPAHAQRQLQAVISQFRDLLKKTPMKVKRLGDDSAAFYQNEENVMLFFTVKHIFIQISLLAPKGQLHKVTEIGNMVEKRIRQPS